MTSKFSFKRYLLLTFLTLLFLPLQVEAKEYNYAIVNFTKLGNGNDVHYSNVGVTPVYRISLSKPGEKASGSANEGFCIDPRKHSSSGTIYIRGDRVEDPELIKSAEVAKTDTGFDFLYTQAIVWEYREKILNTHEGDKDYVVLSGDVCEVAESLGLDGDPGYQDYCVPEPPAEVEPEVQEKPKKNSLFGFIGDLISKVKELFTPKKQEAIQKKAAKRKSADTSKEYYYWYALCDDDTTANMNGKGDKNQFQRFISTYKGTSIVAEDKSDLKEKLKEKYPNINFDDMCKDNPSSDDNKCPDSEVRVAGQCGTETTYNDPYLGESWKCIKGVDKYLDKTVGNEYCRVYCREDVNTYFPGDTGYVFQAGRYFTVGISNITPTWGPIKVTGTRECRTYKSSSTSAEEGINYQKWLEDYINANAKIKSEYNAWQLAYAKSVGKRMQQPCVADVKWTRIGSPTAAGTCLEGVLRDGGCYQGENIMGTQYGVEYHYNNEDNPDWGDCNEPPRTYTHDGGAAYQRAIQARDALENKMAKCETLQDYLNYDLQPTIELNYNSDPQYNFAGELEYVSSPSKSGPIYDKVKEAVSTITNTRVISCGSDTSRHDCSPVYDPKPVQYSYVNVGQKRITIDTVVNYYLSKNLWQYIDKVTGDMSKTTSGLNQYVDLGAGVLPISAYRSPGSYPLSLTYSKVGNIVDNEAHFDKYADYSTGTSTNEYVCNYQVENKLYGRECGEPGKPKYCDPCIGPSCLNPGKHPVGIDVIYRPISLTSPFPSENGKGRKTGDNWCNGSDCSNQNALVKKVITNNRGVKTDDVYNKEPIYSITLTPSLIRKIRDYNEEQLKRKNGGYGDFNLSCDQGTGLNCLSSFIRTSDFASFFSGTCAKAGRSEFESCRK